MEMNWSLILLLFMLGQFVCGNKHCDEKDGLASYEVGVRLFLWIVLSVVPSFFMKLKATESSMCSFLILLFLIGLSFAGFVIPRIVLNKLYGGLCTVLKIKFEWNCYHV